MPRNSARVDVSIIIPIYQRAEMLPLAVRSCVEASQGVSFEVIVVDDGSPVPVESIFDFGNVRLMRLDKNSGSSVARNCGILNAVGRYLKFLDSDDVLLAGSLRHEVTIADKEGCDIVVSGWRNAQLEACGQYRVFSRYPAPIFRSLLDDLLAGHAVPTSAALYRHSSVSSVRWDPELSKLNDWDYFVQCALVSSSIATNPGDVYEWRNHSGDRITTSSSIERGIADFYATLDKLIAAIEARGELTDARRRRAAQYLYKELRRLFRLDKLGARARLREIMKLDPRFVPVDEEDSALFRIMGRLGMLRIGLELYGVFR